MKQNEMWIVRTILLLLLCVLVLAGCGTKDSRTQEADSGKKTVQNESASSGSNAEKTSPDASGAKDAANANNVSGTEQGSREDTNARGNGSAREKELLDLTKMSSTTVFAEVYNMMTDPDSYKGRMVKMKGTCYAAKDDASGKTLYACVIKDATACCSQGIEFKLKEGFSYPQDRSTVTVQGMFTTYQQGRMTYACLKNAELK